MVFNSPLLLCPAIQVTSTIPWVIKKLLDFAHRAFIASLTFQYLKSQMVTVTLTFSDVIFLDKNNCQSAWFLTVNNEFIQCYKQTRLSFRNNQQYRNLPILKLANLLVSNELQIANLPFQMKNTSSIFLNSVNESWGSFLLLLPHLFCGYYFIRTWI